MGVCGSAGRRLLDSGGLTVVPQEYLPDGPKNHGKSIYVPALMNSLHQALLWQGRKRPSCMHMLSTSCFLNDFVHCSAFIAAFFLDAAPF